MNIVDAIREKAQGSTDAAFWKAVANELERKDAAIAELVDLLKYVQGRVFGTLILPEISEAIAKYDNKGKA